MKERPILWSAPMVLAKLSGRKTQTRRIVKPQPRDPYTGRDLPPGSTPPAIDARPYAVVGDRLWGRENWRTHERPADGVDGVIYAADHTFRAIEPTSAAADAWIVAHDNGRHGTKWRPSIFMPRWASRLLDEVVSVRVERLGDISEADAIAEGIEASRAHGVPGFVWHGGALRSETARGAYLAGWDSINGAGSAAKNPWVWVIEFKPLTRSE